MKYPFSFKKISLIDIYMDIAVINIPPHGRFGDKLISVISFLVICKYLNLKPNIITFFTNIEGNWDFYDPKLLEFNQNEFIFDGNIRNSKYIFLHLFYPIKIYDYLLKYHPNLTFEELSNNYMTIAKHVIKPSQIILDKIPLGLEDTYGIHLRKSDRVNDGDDKRLSTLTKELPLIIENLLKDVKNIIDTENNPKFLILSEDNDWKNHITSLIQNYANENNKNIYIYKIEYNNEYNLNNYEAVLDFFCLSKCKEILMGVKSTMFSYAAALLGNNKLRNYFTYDTENYKECIVHAYSSVIKINGINNYDVNYHRQVTNWIDDIVVTKNNI